MKKQKYSSIIKSDQNGFTVVELSIAVVFVLIVAVVGIVAAKQKSPTSTVKFTDTKSAQTLPTAPTPSTTKTTTPTTTSTSTSSSGSTAKTTTSTSSSSPATTSTPVIPSPPPPTQTTPLQELTTLIAGLDAGQSVNVTAENVTIPGPISDATGQPIVFTLYGTTYFAYTQESPPNLNQSPSAAASTFVIVTQTTTSYSVSQAVVGKTGFLTGEDQNYVGYSTGGDTSI